MLDSFWGSTGSKLAERWLEHVFGPAFIFWIGGLFLYAWKIGWQSAVQMVQSLTPFQQGVWMVLSLVILVSSSMLVQAIRFPILRLLEGYWLPPFNFLGWGMITLRKRTFQKKMAKLRRLASADKKTLNVSQLEELTTLEIWAHWHPVNSKDLLPTGLGNILRAREYSPTRKYGLDAIVCWPRLWPLLPENVRADLINARSTLDRLAELCFWGVLSLLWALLLPWMVIISILWVVITYKIACQSAMAYGELLEAAFDLNRFSLYDAMHWPRPQDTQEEQAIGSQLTEYLWRGTLPTPITYLDKEGRSIPKTARPKKIHRASRS
jgi:hypothetical protein